MYKAPVLALSLALLATAPASAQILVLDTQFDGDLTAEDHEAFIEALEQGAERGGPGEVVRASDVSELIGTELASCDGGDCAIAIGLTTPASVAVFAEVYAEAEIYDFTIRVFDLNTGETLVTQTGDCTFCPIAEATESFGFTAEAALGAVDPIPESTNGAEPEPEDPEEFLVVVSDEPEPESSFVAGNIRFNVSAIPEAAEVSINGVSQGDGRLGLDMAAQEFSVVVSAEGYEAYTEDVTLRESMVGPIYLRVVLSPDAPDVIAQPAPPRRPQTGGPSFNRAAVGGTLMGLGLASAAGGIALLSLDGKTTCTDGLPELCRDVWEFTAGGATMTALGGVALGTGIGILIGGSGGANDADEASRSTFSIAPRRNGASVRFSTQF
ncbi:MAG: hypothetical protein ACJAYU_001571 [Bradymonadia bacterium]|jgi:hypothetical protein